MTALLLRLLAAVVGRWTDAPLSMRWCDLHGAQYARRDGSCPRCPRPPEVA